MEHVRNRLVSVLVWSLAEAASFCDVQDARDLRDDAFELLEATADAIALSGVCGRMRIRLESLQESIGAPVARSMVALMRLQSSIQPLSPSPVVVRKSSAPRMEGRVPSPTRTKVSGRGRTLIEYVAAHPDVRTSELEEVFSGTMSSRTIKRMLKDLVGSELLERIEHPNRTVAYRVPPKSS